VREEKADACHWLSGASAGGKFRPDRKELRAEVYFGWEADISPEECLALRRRAGPAKCYPESTKHDN